MLNVDGIQTFYGNVQALFGVSLHVEEGELVALIGANGAGKTTTLKSISGLLAPRSGSIEFEGRRISGLRAYEVVQRGIALCPEGRHVFPDLTVHENLLMGAYTRRDHRAIRADLEDLCEHFPILRERRNQLAGTLSGGQQQMVAIGRALMARPRLVLFDEPSLGLAPVVIQEVARIIAGIHRRGTTVIIVEQNARLALKLADRAYVLETGRVAMHGRGHDLLQDGHVQKIYLGGHLNGAPSEAPASALSLPKEATP